MGAEMTHEVLFRADSQEWATPKALFQALDDEFDFTVDVCATAENAKCARYYDQAMDGLAQPWDGRAWCNPPYGRAVGDWMAKGIAERTTGTCTRAVFLLPARTDTRWFHTYCWDRTSHEARSGVRLRFLKGRIRFEGAEAGAPFPSLVIIV
jgi:site-specific DNA-methyltransferase (adenine-specific)